MKATELQSMCIEAMRRVQIHINRVAGQQVRHMRAAWSKPV